MPETFMTGRLNLFQRADLRLGEPLRAPCTC